MNKIDIADATIDDLPGWLELAGEVEPLFGPMAHEESFRDHLKKSIANRCCFCVRPETPGHAMLRGAIAVSFDTNEICWLAVSRVDRGNGLGRLLLAHALTRLDPARDIRVQTFADGVTEGRAARALYLHFGFRDCAMSDPTPTGIPTVIMKKPARGKI